MKKRIFLQYIPVGLLYLLYTFLFIASAYLIYEIRVKVGSINMYHTIGNYSEVALLLIGIIGLSCRKKTGLVLSLLYPFASLLYLLAFRIITSGMDLETNLYSSIFPLLFLGLMLIITSFSSYFSIPRREERRILYLLSFVISIPLATFMSFGHFLFN